MYTLIIRRAIYNLKRYYIKWQNIKGACCLHHQGGDALMMEAARTSETSVDICLTTRQYIAEDSELHTHCRESLKSHMF